LGVPLAQWFGFLLSAWQAGLNVAGTERDIYVQFVGVQDEVVVGEGEEAVSEGEES
jgi:hypothetical protein